MHDKFRKAISLALALLICASVVFPAVTCRVSAVSYSGSESYMSGMYYQALTQVRITGDPRTDIVNIAQSQVGYKEGWNNSQLDGTNSTGDNHTEYGHWYGAQTMWCAIFVSWCANVAGVSTGVIPKHASTSEGLSWFRSRDLAYSRKSVASGKYTPRAGDLVYFKSSRTSGTTNHVGLVTGYSGGTLYTVEGNVGAGSSPTGGGVKTYSYSISDTYIVYICSPEYTETTPEIATLPAELKPVVAPAEPAILPAELKPVELKEEGSDDADAGREQMEKLRRVIYAMETGGKASYDDITEVCGRAMSIGCGQWYGAEAQELLCRIRSEDEKAFNKLDVAGIGTDLDEEDWNQYLVSEDSEKYACIRTILSSQAGKQVQDEMMDEQLVSFMEGAKTQATAKRKAKMILRYLGGTSAVDKMLVQVKEGYTPKTICTALNVKETVKLHQIVK